MKYQSDWGLSRAWKFLWFQNQNNIKTNITPAILDPFDFIKKKRRENLFDYYYFINQLYKNRIDKTACLCSIGSLNTKPDIINKVSTVHQKIKFNQVWVNWKPKYKLKDLTTDGRQGIKTILIKK